MDQNVLSCRLASYRKYADDAWTHLPHLQVHCIEAPVPDGDDAAGQFAQRLEASGLKVRSFQGKLDLSGAEPAGQLGPQLAMCRRFGVDRLFLSVKRQDLPEAAAYDRLRVAGDAAREVGVTIILETHPDLVTNGEVAAATMRGVDHPNVRINFDTANVHFYNENVTSVGELAKMLPWVEGVHLKESLGKLKDFNFPALGTGIVDFPAIVRMLNERRFFGPFTMELEGTTGVEFTREQTLAHVEESVRYLRSTGLF